MLTALWKGEDPAKAIADAQKAIEAAAPSR